jgi:hypothetical protein
MTAGRLSSLLAASFEQSLGVRGLFDRTIEAYQRTLTQFSAYRRARQPTGTEGADTPHIRAFLSAETVRTSASLALKVIWVVQELALVPVFRTVTVQVPLGVEAVPRLAWATHGDPPSPSDMIMSTTADAGRRRHPGCRYQTRGWLGKVYEHNGKRPIGSPLADLAI